MRIPGNLGSLSHLPLPFDLFGAIPQHAADPLIAHNPPNSRLIASGLFSALTGGGDRARDVNPLESIYPEGRPPASSQPLVDFVADPTVLANLRNGEIYCWIQKVGTSLPQFNTLSLIPAPARQVYECAKNVKAWAEWMPRFLHSDGTPIEGSSDIFHEVLMNADAYDFNYQARMSFFEGSEEFQIQWTIPQNHGFNPTKGKGLRINNGSWTFAPLPGDPSKTIMAYQIHTDPDLPSWLLKPAALVIVPLTTREFHSIIQAVANRSVDPTWRRERKDNPSNVVYKKPMLGA